MGYFVEADAPCLHQIAQDDGGAPADAHLAVHEHVALGDILLDKFKASFEVLGDVFERTVVDFYMQVVPIRKLNL